jgi:Sulfotransferase family
VIISHEHRFVFVKTRKTAGTSVEVFLERIAGDDAVVTPIWPEVPGHLARNYMALDNPVRARVLEARQRRLTGDARQRPAYFNHIAARNIRKRLGRRRWRSYYKFCFERNPWEKVVSEYFWRIGNGHPEVDFRSFVMRGDFPTDFDKYSLDGVNLGVDFVGRHERLTDDLRTVLAHLGLPTDVSLTREKGNYRPRTGDADVLFDDEMSARVEQVFAREIHAFGYSRPTALVDPSGSTPRRG